MNGVSLVSLALFADYWRDAMRSYQQVASRSVVPDRAFCPSLHIGPPAFCQGRLT